MAEICGDNRFELIEKYKTKLIEATNIETAKDEMAVIDSILFRFWQKGWLDKLEADVVPKSEVVAMMQWVELLKTQLAEAKQEVAREIFEEIENRAFGFGACFVEMTRTTFDEIKKKYTESEGKNG